jgi:hypothetical protein
VIGEAEPTVRLIDHNEWVVHIVGRIEEMRSRLRGRAPYALCGEYLEGDPDRPEPGANAPVCESCKREAGWTR